MTTTNGAVAGIHRRSRAKAERLVSEFEQSGMGRKEFCAVHGLSVHTLDAWRKRRSQSGSQEKMVPVEIVEDGAARLGAMRAASVGRNGQFRVMLTDGVRIEIEPGFDEAELRRLLALLDSMQLRGCLPVAV